MSTSALSTQQLSLGRHQAQVEALAEVWTGEGNVAKLWKRDASLFSNTDEAKWMGWLDIVEAQLAEVATLVEAAEDARKAEGIPGGFRHVVVLGMGGSSLCPEVMSRTFGKRAGYPELKILDSTVPAQVRTLDAELDPSATLFVVASKSGGTIEPNVFKQYFYDRTAKTVGAENVGKHFIAVTDPRTKMQSIAEADKFREIYFGLPDIGGRFSALSNFGMVPSASAGIDVPAFLQSAQLMVEACGARVPANSNPGVLLGLAMGVLAKAGRDKVTVIASPGIGSLGAWLEQLIAESTGKLGTGIVPVEGEQVGSPAAYGDDRFFAYARLASAPDAKQDAAIAALKQAGHPVATFEIPSTMHLGQEFFRWEIATAVAGAVLNINPFNQPDVESAKIAARSLMEAYEQSGQLPDETPIAVGGGFKLFTDEKNAAALQSAAGGLGDAAAVIRAHLARIGRGDYFAINAYVEMNAAHDAELQAVRHKVRDGRKVATTIGYGPRFLHSTGQLHKGGPNSGVFLQITSDDAADLAIPGQKFSFGVLKAAQAQGDFAVLVERGRRILRVHLGADVKTGLAALRKIVEEA